MNIFIHHRDIRINDNTTLNKMSESVENIIPIFIFTPEQIDKNKNEYFSNSLVCFMCKSLEELYLEYKSKKCKMNFYYGNTLKIIKEINDEYKINSIGFNVDYSPFSKQRDNEIIDWANKKNIKIFYEEDMLLVSIMDGKTLKKNTTEAYKKFTPFKNYLKEMYEIQKIKNNKIIFNNKNLKTKNSINTKYFTNFYEEENNLNVLSGRKEALKKLNLIKEQKEYNTMRNFLSYKTSNISAYINLGLISIRELYFKIIEKLGINNNLIDELYWRDFYYNILYFYPHVVGNSFNEKYDNIKWNNDKNNFKKWCQGKTGFPIIDACMSQLNKTGYMHNRGRMIVASFLTKDLLIDWRWGEKYFATKLLDYNISANNGGWQWASGSGTDSQPYFRIFNPWTQSKTYDKDCIYIKEWISELKNVDNKDIHTWFKTYKNYTNINYPKPIIDHNKERLNALKIYKKYV
jgi:deoxyribodipyrimidine photo-lyase